MTASHGSDPMRKEVRLNRILSGLKSVVIAYSGGLDSTYLCKTAFDALGKDNVIAVTARSETYPASEYAEARRIAMKMGLRHLTVRTSELGLKKFKENPVDRCYYCKRELFKKLDGIKRRYGMDYVVDGTNFDDLKDVRHGTRAARELGVRSPLLEAGITKQEIRKFSKALRLPTWGKPSFACLASRIPFGSPITIRDLARVEESEAFLRRLGFGQIRVRAHGDIARIEADPAEFAAMIRLKGRICEGLHKTGFVYVAMDMEGYRTGSMHEAKGGA